MNGTSIDGIDISLIQSDGKNFIRPMFNKTYNYTKIFKNNIKNFLEQLNLEKVSNYVIPRNLKLLIKSLVFY